MYGLKDSDLEYIINLLKRYPQIDQAIIFGSRAKDTQKSGSDIDLALKGNNISEIVITISGQLNDESPLPYDVDVLDYDSIERTALKEHIDRVGKILYNKQ